MRRTSLHYSLKGGNIVHVKEIKHLIKITFILYFVACTF